jgi:hypothetical protein
MIPPESRNAGIGSIIDDDPRLDVHNIQAIGVRGLQLPGRDHRLNVAADLSVGDSVRLVEDVVAHDSRTGRAAADVVTGVGQHVHVRAVDDRRDKLIELGLFRLERRTVPV